MGYRREDIPEIIEALRIARGCVFSAGICWQMTMLLASSKITDKQHALCRGLMAEALGGKYVWLHEWMSQRGSVAKTKRQKDAQRRRWIDKMIRDLQQYAKEPTP